MGEAKRKNQRACPALGRTISATECGTERNTSIPCPVDCPFNPFSPANYLDQYGPIEQKVIDKTLVLLRSTLTSWEQREITNATSVHEIHALTVWHIHGRDLLGRWKAEGKLDGWKNDELFMARCLSTMRVALLEFVRAEGATSSIVRDLLQPELGEINLIDASIARQSKRYNIFLTWIYRVPAGWRSSGSGIGFERRLEEEPADDFNTLLEHLEAPPENREKWLLEHMNLLRDAIVEIANARTQRSYEKSDLREITREFSGATKTIRSLADALREHSRMNEHDDAPEDYSGDVLASPMDGIAAIPLIGTLKIDDATVRARAMTLKRADALREFLLELEPSLKQTNETINDLAKEMSRPVKQPELVPEALLSDAGAIDLTQSLLPDRNSLSFTDGLLDLAVPALGGLSPREAADKPALRGKLIRLLKGHINNLDRMRIEQGFDIDLNPQLAELGLDELIQPPPPLGERKEDPSSRSKNPPPRPLLEGEKLHERIKEAVERILDSKDKWQGLDAFLEAVLDLPYEEITDKESSVLYCATEIATLTLHPRFSDHMEPDIDRMYGWYDE